jgi:hypothetical protein
MRARVRGDIRVASGDADRGGRVRGPRAVALADLARVLLHDPGERRNAILPCDPVIASIAEGLVQRRVLR